MDSQPRPAEELWRRTLANIPSIYGRLAYLASLVNVDSGRYEHHGLANIFGAEEADKALRKSHEQALIDWLSLQLEQQKADLELYFSSLPPSKKTLVESWTRLKPYRMVVPASASRAQRELFESNLAILLQILRSELELSPEP
ncbi:MAG: hypothetical protein WHT08_14855 [Bryobacteraceae bacterium]|jgi:hypothetical protein